MRCPQPECDKFVSFEIMQECLNEAEFERLERLLLQRALDSMPDIVYCPECSQPITIDEADTHCFCMYCNIDYCRNCKDKWHSVSPLGPTTLNYKYKFFQSLLQLKGECETGEAKLKKQTAALNMKPADLMKMTDEEIAAKFKDITFVTKLRKKYIEHVNEEKMLLSKYLKCPKCKAPIEKYDGCNKVTCICGQIICYICGQKITGYDHFTENIKCSLWSNSVTSIQNRVPARPRNEVNRT